MPLINAHAVVSSKARILNFGLSFHLHPYFVYASICPDSPEPSMLVYARDKFITIAF